MTITVAAALIVGVAIDAWVFTPHEWNVHWVADVAVLPGVYFGGFVWVALGRPESFEALCIISGIDERVAADRRIGWRFGPSVPGTHDEAMRTDSAITLGFQPTITDAEPVIANRWGTHLNLATNKQ